MKIKGFMTMMAVATALVFGVCSCGGDDDEPEVALASQVIGSYTGNEVIMVDNDESSNETKTYEITKASDITIDLAVPEVGMGGMMTIPAFSVKGITLAKSNNAIVGKLASYNGTVVNAKGEEKAYTISDATVMFSEKTVVAKFSLKYGNMPFIMATTFTGIKK